MSNNIINIIKKSLFTITVIFLSFNDLTGTNTAAVNKDEEKLISTGSIKVQIISADGWIYPGTYTRLNNGPKDEADNYGSFLYEKLLPGIYHITVLVQYQIPEQNYPVNNSSEKSFSKKKKKKSQRKESGYSENPEAVGNITYNFVIRNIRINSGEAVNIGIIHPELNKDILFGNEPSEEELKSYEELRNKYKIQEEERIRKYREELEKKGSYNNFLGGETLYPVVGEAAIRSLLPGFGQFYNRRKVRGLFYLCSEITAFSSYLIFSIQGNNYDRQYQQTESLHKEYPDISPDMDIYNKAVNYNKYADVSLLCAVGIAGIAMIDAVIDAAITSSDIKDQLQFSSGMDKDSYSINLSYSF